MREEFFEETVYLVDSSREKKKYILFNIISKIFYVLMVIAIIFNLNSLLTSPFPSGVVSVILYILLLVSPIVFCFLAGFFLGKTKKKFYNEFDYTFVSGSFRFSKVIMNKKRVFINKFETSQVEKIGKYGSNGYNLYTKNPKIKRVYLTNNSYPAEGKDFYYMVFNQNGEKFLYLLECTEKFIVNILHFMNSTVWERDTTRKIWYI